MYETLDLHYLCGTCVVVDPVAPVAREREVRSVRAARSAAKTNQKSSAETRSRATRLVTDGRIGRVPGAVFPQEQLLLLSGSNSVTTAATANRLPPVTRLSHAAKGALQFLNVTRCGVRYKEIVSHSATIWFALYPAIETIV